MDLWLSLGLGGSDSGKWWAMHSDSNTPHLTYQIRTFYTFLTSLKLGSIFQPDGVTQFTWQYCSVVRPTLNGILDTKNHGKNILRSALRKSWCLELHQPQGINTQVALVQDRRSRVLPTATLPPIPTAKHFPWPGLSR